MVDTASVTAAYIITAKIFSVVTMKEKQKKVTENHPLL